MADIKGTQLGRYRVLDALGKGGMATVYKAFDPRLERNVAIKVIRASEQEDEGFRRRFEREARALAQLEHPNIVKVIDYGQEGDTPYLVMPYLPGGTLRKLMGEPMPFNEAARLLAPLARGLAHAHRHDVIHRDIKPPNILITEDGEPMLSDFGIAYMLEDPDSTQLTQTGMGLGTPGYMAPEQWTGEAVEASDTYSLGIIFYELVTGKKPYTADTPAAILLKQMNDPLPDPCDLVPDLPQEAQRLIFKVLAREPEERFESMQAFAERLNALSLMDAQAAGEALRVRRAGKAAPRWRTIVYPLVALLALGGVYIGLSRLSGPAEVAEPPAAPTPETEAAASAPTIEIPAFISEYLQGAEIEAHEPFDAPDRQNWAMAWSSEVSSGLMSLEAEEATQAGVGINHLPIFRDGTAVLGRFRSAAGSTASIFLESANHYSGDPGNRKLVFELQPYGDSYVGVEAYEKGYQAVNFERYQLLVPGEWYHFLLAADEQGNLLVAVLDDDFSSERLVYQAAYPDYFSGQDWQFVSNLWQGALDYDWLMFLSLDGIIVPAGD